MDNHDLTITTITTATRTTTATASATTTTVIIIIIIIIITTILHYYYFYYYYYYYYVNYEQVVSRMTFAILHHDVKFLQEVIILTFGFHIITYDHDHNWYL